MKIVSVLLRILCSKHLWSSTRKRLRDRLKGFWKVFDSMYGTQISIREPSWSRVRVHCDNLGCLIALAIQLHVADVAGNWRYKRVRKMHGLYWLNRSRAILVLSRSDADVIQKGQVSPGVLMLSHCFIGKSCYAHTKSSPSLCMYICMRGTSVRFPMLSGSKNSEKCPYRFQHLLSKCANIVPFFSFWSFHFRGQTYEADISTRNEAIKIL